MLLRMSNANSGMPQRNPESQNNPAYVPPAYGAQPNYTQQQPYGGQNANQPNQYPYANGQPNYTQQPNYMQPDYTQQYQAAPPQGYPSVNNPQDRWNGMCIAGFVCSFVIPVVGLILSIIALVQINKSGEKSKGMAIAGIAISAVRLVLEVVFFLLIVTGMLAGLGYALDYDYDYSYGDDDYDYSQYDDIDASYIANEQAVYDLATM